MACPPPASLGGLVQVQLLISSAHSRTTNPIYMASFSHDCIPPVRPATVSFRSTPMHDSPSLRAQLPIQAMHMFLAIGNLAVGLDVTLDQDYQIPPLADLDAIMDLLPAYSEALDWEPENGVQSDDNGVRV